MENKFKVNKELYKTILEMVSTSGKAGKYIAMYSLSSKQIDELLAMQAAYEAEAMLRREELAKEKEIAAKWAVDNNLPVYIQKMLKLHV